MDSDDQYQEGVFKKANLYVPNVKGFESQLGHVSPVMSLSWLTYIHQAGLFFKHSVWLLCWEHRLFSPSISPTTLSPSLCPFLHPSAPVHLQIQPTRTTNELFSNSISCPLGLV